MIVLRCHDGGWQEAAAIYRQWFQKELYRYVGEVTRIRRDLHASVSRGCWIDSHEKLFASRTPVLRLGNSVQGSPQLGWTVFADEQTGKRTVVLANLGGAAVEVNDVRLVANPSGGCRVYQPFQATREAQFPLTLTLAAERVVFVVET